MDQKIHNEYFKKYSSIVIFITMLAVSTLGLFGVFKIFMSQGYLIFGFPVSILGIVAGVYIIKGNKIGSTLGIIWAALQIFILNIGEYLIDLSQGFSLSFGFSLRPEYPFGLDINIIAILFLLVFIKERKFKYTK